MSDNPAMLPAFTRPFQQLGKEKKTNIDFSARGKMEVKSVSFIYKTKKIYLLNYLSTIIRLHLLVNCNINSACISPLFKIIIKNNTGKKKTLHYVIMKYSCKLSIDILFCIRKKNITKNLLILSHINGKCKEKTIFK